MTDDVDSRIDELFHASLERQPEERAAFLNQVCGGDLALQREVESLVAAHESVNGFLQTPLLDGLTTVPVAIASLIYDDPTAAVGQRLGHYEIVELIATGGMGAVYRAVRADDSYDQQVAIKVIRFGITNQTMRNRFHLERQTLAKLQHPFITRLIDGGSTDDGLPYLIMEYVDGKPIDQHCDNRRLNVAERIRLFRQVCEAVHYAHQNLIVHRDLKPSNTLITDDGLPKLLDFGIAKLLDAGAASLSADATVTLFRALTPRYASPEQIRGDPVATSSDVYSLGVLLYELLTGHRPYQLKSSANYENEKIICEKEPATPSLIVSRTEDIIVPEGTTDAVTPELVGHLRGLRPAQLRRHLRGDLDNIVLMAMQKDPQRRYASVQQFSEDLRRYLEGLPVIARKDTLTYRAAKLVKRNKGITIVSSALVMALLVGIVGTTRGLLRTRLAEMQAQQDRTAAIDAQEKAQSVAAFLQDVLASANPYRTGRDASEVLELLDDAGKRVQADYAGQPATEAAVRYAIANTYVGLWNWPKAKPHLHRALQINRELYGDTHPAIADCLILLGRALTFTRDDDAIGIQREALAIRHKLFAENGPEVAWAKTCLAFALWHSTPSEQRVAPERLAEAEPLAFEALDVQRPLRDVNGLELAISLHTVAAMHIRKDERENAAQVLPEALDVYRALPEQEDRYLAECVRLYAHTLRELGRTEEEEPLWREYIERTPRAFLPNVEPRNALWRLGTLVRLKAASATDSTAAAAALFEDSADFYRRAMAAECENWSRNHPNLSEDFPAITSLLASEADATQLASVAKRLNEIVDPDESKEASDFFDRLSLPGELLADMERYAE